MHGRVLTVVFAALIAATLAPYVVNDTVCELAASVQVSNQWLLATCSKLSRSHGSNRLAVYAISSNSSINNTDRALLPLASPGGPSSDDHRSCSTATSPEQSNEGDGGWPSPLRYLECPKPPDGFATRRQLSVLPSAVSAGGPGLWPEELAAGLFAVLAGVLAANAYTPALLAALMTSAATLQTHRQEMAPLEPLQQHIFSNWEEMMSEVSAAVAASGIQDRVQLTVLIAATPSQQQMYRSSVVAYTVVVPG